LKDIFFHARPARQAEKVTYSTEYGHDQIINLPLKNRLSGKAENTKKSRQIQKNDGCAC